MARIGDVHANIILSGDAKRALALQHAVQSRQLGWTDQETVDTAKAYLAFLDPHRDHMDGTE